MSVFEVGVGTHSGSSHALDSGVICGIIGTSKWLWWIVAGHVKSRDRALQMTIVRNSYMKVERSILCIDQLLVGMPSVSVNEQFAPSLLGATTGRFTSYPHAFHLQPHFKEWIT